MTATQEGTKILKTDERGRVRTTRARRQELLEEFDRSGLAAPKFAALTGLKYQTLAGWLQRRRKERDEVAPVVTPGQESKVQWLETVMEKAQVPPTARACPLVVRLPSGAVIEVAHAAHAALVGEVLRSWERAGAC